MRQTISGLLAAVAVVSASAAPAMACGGGFFQGCSTCGQAYVEPCAQTYVPAYTYSGCYTGCGGWWGYDRLPDPVQQYQSGPVHHQYYYVNQGPTYSGPGAFAPYPTYEEGDWGAYRHHPYYAPRHGYGYGEPALRRYY